jgi:gliding motility-associated-like protein
LAQFRKRANNNLGLFAFLIFVFFRLSYKFLIFDPLKRVLLMWRFYPYVLLLFIFLGLSPDSVRATHIVGGNLSYECLGFNTTTNVMSLRIRLFVYRDAINGQAAFDNPAIVSAFVGTNATTPAQTFQLFTPVITNIPLVLNNPCLAVPPNVRVEEAIYTTTITLPYNAAGYTLAYQRCCRNGTINNLVNPGDVGSTYPIYLSPQAMTGCNSSPRYRNFPPIAICRGQPLTFDHSATDANGHRLEYELCTSFNGADRFTPAPNPPAGPPYINVPFSTGFSATFPMPANPAISINRTTGLLTGTPTQIGQYVVGVCVLEFDANNVLLSRTLRDFQFNVAYCENTVFALLDADSVSADSNRFFFRRCDQTALNFVNRSRRTDVITDYKWDFSTLPSTTDVNPSANFGYGNFTAQLIANPNTNTCKDTAFIFISLYANPVPVINLQIDSCNPSRPPIGFSSLGSTVAPPSSIAQYNWDFGDASPTSNLANPSHVYQNPNTYTINLRLTSNHGCTASIPRTTQYFPPASPNFTISDNSGCVPHAVQFGNTSAPVNANYTYAWGFGNGQNGNGQNASTIFTQPNTYVTTLTVSSPWGCQTSITQPITVFTPPNAAFTVAYDSCVVDTVRMTDASTPASGNTLSGWAWNFGDNNTSPQRNARHLYQLANTYDIRLIVTDNNGCTDTANRLIRWYPAPIINVNNIDTGCAALSVLFNNQSYPINGYTTAWTFGNGQTSPLASPTAYYPNAGSFPVRLLITSPIGCTAEYRDTILVRAAPNASFVLQYDSCLYAPIRFDETSTPNPAGNALTSWQWVFGDGQGLLARDTSHLYVNAGDYTASLYVEDINGCRDTASRLLRWYPRPILNIRANDSILCQNETVNFTNLSQPMTPAYTFNWRFGDGQSSTLLNPSHQYTQYGNFIVSLSISSPIGCVENYRDTILVHQLPNANFSYVYDSCAFTGVRIINQSSPNLAGNALTNWNWAFGNGGTSTLNFVDTLYPYAPRANYNIQLIVQDINGCRDTNQQLLRYFPDPVFPVASHNLVGCVPQTVAFTNNPLNNYPGYAYEWVFGDGRASASFDTTIIYPNRGVFFPTLTVRTPAGCVGVFRDTIRANGLPMAAFSYSFDSCAISPVTFRNRSVSSPDASITTLAWTFGDGQGSNLPLVQHQYNFPDTQTYTVRLVVTDANGCTDDSIRAVPWFPKPIFPITLTNSIGCLPLVVPTPTPNPYPVPSYSSVWDFGNGFSTNQGNPADYVYTQAGTYTRRLVVVAPNGCRDTFSSQHTALAVPTANFSYAPNPLNTFNPLVQFTDLSQLASGWEWAFGKGRIPANSYQQNPAYNYQDTGVFRVELVAIHQNGCRDTAVQLLDIVPKFTYFLPNAFTPNLDGLNDGFRGQGIFTYIQAFNMQIFNRWGELIFETNNPYEAWNGRKDNTGQMSPAGVYVVQVNLTGARGEKEQIRGFATIVF